MATNRYRIRFRWIVIGATLLLIGYPLSLGPILWLLDKPRVPDRYVGTAWSLAHKALGIYAPLRMACRCGPPQIENTLERYARLWCGRFTFRIHFMQDGCWIGDVP